MDSEVMESPEVTSKIIGDLPNTYVFTKVRFYDKLHILVCRHLQRAFWSVRPTDCLWPS